LQGSAQTTQSIAQEQEQAKASTRGFLGSLAGGAATVATAGIAAPALAASRAVTSAITPYTLSSGNQAIYGALIMVSGLP